MAILPVYALTVYDTDDSTVLFDVSTDPAHARPYLKAPSGLPEQEVDFAQGAASIGQVNVHVVDVRQTATDQATGYLTGQLSDTNGNSQLNGHRALLTEDIGAGPVTMLDGVIRSVRLLDTFASYELELRDIRERERLTKAFETTDSPTILPRGILNGYGVTVNGVKYPVPATQPLTATYRSQTANDGYIDFTNANQTERALTAPMREAFATVAPLAAEPETLVYDRWKVLWRDKAIGGAYTTVDQVAHRGANVTGRSPFTEGQGRIIWLVLNNFVSGAALPTDGQTIEVIVQYDGPPTEDWPHYFEDLTVGEFLRNGYRGDYSVEDPRIRYDETALLALKTPVRGRITEPIEDFRGWAEDHAYPVAKAAPTLNAAGEISPITYVLPDASVSLVTLNDSNCAQAGGGWSHGSENAINVVRVTYKRDYRIRPKPGAQLALSDQIRTVKVITEHRVQSSIDLLGEQTLEVESDLLRSIGTSDGEPLSGDVTDETGTQVARSIGRLASDRFVLGGQYFVLKGDRSDSNVEGLEVGSWTSVGVSWMPDYIAGTRGANRLAQIVGRRNLNAAWCLLTLIDAGSDNAPLGQPTLGTITADAEGVVSIPVTALASGNPDARVDFAVNATEPAADSELWTFLDRADQVETLTTPPLPAGGTCWVRARSEAPGERPSAYTTAVSVAIPQTARIFYLEVELDDGGEPTFRWSPNAHCLGVEIAYEVHKPDTVPTYPNTVDVDATLGTHTLTGVKVPDDRILSAQVTPYDGWTGSAVTGTAGPLVEINSETGVTLDLSGVFQLRPVPVMSGTSRRHELRLSFDLGSDVDEVDIQVDYVEPGPDPQNYTYTVSLSGSGLHTIHESAITSTPLRLTDGATSVGILVTPKNTTYSKTGPGTTLRIEDITETGSGMRVFDGSNEYLAPRVLVGSGLTLGLNAGEPELTGGGGSVAALEDVGDVDAYAALAAGEVLQWSGTGWQHQTLAEADIAAASVTLTAGAGLAGGGDLTANRSFAVNTGAGVTITADNVVLDIGGLTLDAGPLVALDRFAVEIDGVGSRKIAPANIGLSLFNNDAGFTAGALETASTGLTTVGSDVQADYSGTDNIILAAAGGELTALATADRIMVSDATDNVVHEVTLATLEGFVTIGAAQITAGTFGAGDYVFPAGSDVQVDGGNAWSTTAGVEGTLGLSHSAGTAGQGNFGASITFPKIGSGVNGGQRAAIVLRQEGSDDDAVSLVVFAHPSITSADPVEEIAQFGGLGVTDAFFAGPVRIGGDADTGLTLPADGTLGFEAAGVLRLDLDSIDATHGRFRFDNGQVYVEGQTQQGGTATVTLDWDGGNVESVTNDGTVTIIDIDDASMQWGGVYTLEIEYTAGSTTSFTWTVAGTIKWQFGTAPTLPTATVGDRTIVTFVPGSDGVVSAFYADAT